MSQTSRAAIELALVEPVLFDRWSADENDEPETVCFLAGTRVQKCVVYVWARRAKFGLRMPRHTSQKSASDGHSFAALAGSQTPLVEMDALRPRFSASSRAGGGGGVVVKMIFPRWNA